MTFVILEAMNGSQLQQVLIDKDEYDDNGYVPEDYFKYGCTDAKIVGEIQCIGDTGKLHSQYTADAI